MTAIKIRQKNTMFLLCFLLLLTIVSLLIASSQGALSLNLWDIIQGDVDAYFLKIWLDIRLPRVFLASLIGAAMALSGTILQGLFRNPLADPGLLGISSGAALMVSLSLLIIPSLPNHFLFRYFNDHPVFQHYLLGFSAFIGSSIVTFLVLLFSLKKQTSLLHLLLLGIAINAINGGAMGMFTYLSNDNQLRQFSLWTIGSLAGASWPTVFTASVILIPLMFISFRFRKAVNLLQLGQEQAFYMGINVKKTQWQLLMIVALMTAICVSLTGIIGFVGLVIPHLFRLQVGSDNRFLFPATILGGSLFLLISDTVARTLLLPTEIPVGIITSLIGGPYFLFLIIKTKNILN